MDMTDISAIGNSVNGKTRDRKQYKYLGDQFIFHNYYYLNLLFNVLFWKKSVHQFSCDSGVHEASPEQFHFHCQQATEAKQLALCSQYNTCINYDTARELI